MKSRLVCTVPSLVFFAVLVSAPTVVEAQGAPASFSNSTDGLQKLVWAMIAAEKREGAQALAPFLQSLELPNANDWFTATFGAESGQTLAIFYHAWAGPRDSQITGDIARSIAMQMNDVAALSFTRPGDAGATGKDNYFLGLVKQEQPFYAVNFQAESGATHAIIGENGNVCNLRVIDGNSLLAASAMAAVRQWHYAPYKLNGKPVKVNTTITVVFRLGP